MRRNVVLTASSAIILILLFLVYTYFVPDPDEGQVRPGSVGKIAAPDRISRENAITIGPGGQIVLPSGGELDLTEYDDRTGLPIRRIKYVAMRPVPGDRKQFHFTKPVLSQRLPSGGIVTISADEGWIFAERVNKKNALWKHGRLKGNTRIVVNRRSLDDESAANSGEFADVVTITLDDLSFDLELGTLKTDGPLSVIGSEFEIEGVGLNLIWNQAANRIDELHIRQGKRMALFRESGLLGFGGAAADAAKPDAESDEADGEQPQAQPASNRALTSYLCILGGAVEAVRYDKEDRPIAALSAGGLQLLFDIGRGGGLFGSGSDEQATTQPTSRTRARLELTWSGGLSLVATDPPAKPMRWGRKRGERPAVTARRRLTALGPDVRLSQGNSTILCGELEFFDDTGQIWLHRGDHPNVRMKLDENSFATAAAIYIDRASNVIKLVGDVYLESKRRSSSPVDARGRDGASIMTIACSQMAELHLYAQSGGRAGAELSEELGNISSELRSASFFGDVRVSMGDRRLETHRLDMDFRKLAAGEPFEALIESAVATGEVIFTGENYRVDSGALELDFGVAADGTPFVSRIDARGKVEMTRGKSWLRGERVKALLDKPAQLVASQRSDEFAIRTIDVYGNAELRRPEDNLGARGDHIAVWIDGENEFKRAVISGTAGRPAIVHARPYTVRGDKIDIDGPSLSLNVDGWSRLTFISERGLPGGGGRPSKVVVTGDKALRIDGLKNTVVVDGNAVATRGNEQLAADTITLYLEDVEEPQRSRPETIGFSQFVQAFKSAVMHGGVMRAPPAARRQNRSTGVFGITDAQLGRKEPVRLEARNALFRMEVPDPQSDRPLVHRSISAPLLEVDILSKTIYTTGITDLLVQDYRVDPSQERRGAAQLIPSDLISGGPMQTVIRCEDGLTYALGGDEPGARDSVVLEGGVEMLHLTGREILDFDKMPRMAQLDDETLRQLKDRYTTLDCERLECQFGAGDGTPLRAGESEQLGARLMWLLASRNVHLVDRQGNINTEINAQRISFDRVEALVSIFGEDGVDARVYRWDTSQNKFSQPFIGPRFQLDMRNGTIRAEGRGELRP